MKKFSEESILLVKNWDTVQDIFEAEKQLRKELSSLLFSVESELTQNGWWQEGWIFVRYQESQVYISNQDWRSNDEFAVWIGIEGLVPECIFGMGSPSTLYVWVSEKPLAQMLVEQLEEGEYEILGVIDHRSSGYVVRHAVRKYLPGEDIEKFGEIVRNQILDFFVHYAKIIGRSDKIIKSYLGIS